MLKKIKEIKENKVLKTIWNIMYYILVVFVVLILITVVLQRVSNNNLSLGGFRIFNIISESMYPKYKIGDVLLAKTVDSNTIRVGDDVVYRGVKGDFANKIITHQVIEIEEENGQKIFHTKGIANPEEDPTIVKDQICGKVIYKIKTLSMISKLIYNLYSFYFVVFIPIAIIIFIEIRKTTVDLHNRRKNKN